MPNHDIKHAITTALQSFKTGSLTDCALGLFKTLGYNTSRQAPLSTPTYVDFYDSYAAHSPRFREDKAYVEQWEYVDLLFQLSADELRSQLSIFDTSCVDDTIIESYLFFTIGLSENSYSRTALSQITREVNKIFPMPAMLLFKHGNTLTLAAIDRRKHKKDEQKDVLEKVTLIKDIQIENTHRAHLEILADLSLPELASKYTITNFVELHNAWQKTLDTKELNKRFFKELSNWYFWAMHKVSFPDDVEKNAEIRNATNLIRLITRIIFVWFIKEKSLVPDQIFQPAALKKILKEFCKDDSSHSYYLAILQNLFFGILNQKMNERKFAKDEGFLKNRSKYGIKTLLRYEGLFKISQAEVLDLFKGVPFLNGGLFDCLDKEDENHRVLYVDGFSRNNRKQAVVPDYLFFGGELELDLNSIYGTRNKRYTTKGLFAILSNYKFTVTENTPIEEEVALDPELLGKVFENLLASYNPETKTTARKQTGSFYTPREIVNYMVDESLIAYLMQKLDEAGYPERDEDLRELLSYTEKPNPFNEAETAVLIKAVDGCKILDPACGSGAFPMGILHKMVHILHKLDPQNELWKERQIEKAGALEDTVLRDKAIRNIEEAFANNELDYGRKLYLIENCIYGVDIQPIAVQIAKLRFFISLIIDQQKQPERDNLGIQSLPNLETKFVAANTLIPLEKPEGQISIFTYDNPEIETLKNKLKQIRHRYFNAKTRNDKLRYQKQDKSAREKLAQHLMKDGWSEHTVQQLVAFDPYDQNASAPFFDPEWMFGLNNGFDIVIGNPPYISLQKMRDNEKKYLENIGYQTYSKSGDIYCLFYEKSIQLLKRKGISTFITSNSWLRTKYGELLRNYFVEKTNPLQLLNFEDSQLFESAIVETSIFITQNSDWNYSLKALSVGNNHQSLSDYFHKKHNTINSLGSQSWNTGELHFTHLMRKIECGSTLLENFNVTINFGIKTGFNKAFLIDEQTKNYLISKDVKNNEIIVPILRGRDVSRYSHRFSNVWLINTHNGFKGIKPVDVIKDYPSIYDYLKQYQKQLQKRQDQGKHWTNLRNCAYLEAFSKEKIIWGELSDKPKFSFDSDGLYAEATLFFMTGDNLKYLLAILNSKLSNWYFNQISTSSGMGTNRWKKYKIGLLPIKDISLTKQQAIIEIVNIIISAKKQNPESDITQWDNEIDQLIYMLYNLTDDEIAIVEGNIS